LHGCPFVSTGLKQSISHSPRSSYLNPSTPAFPNSIWHSSTRRVNHRHQSYKAEFFYRKVYFVCVKLEFLRAIRLAVSVRHTWRQGRQIGWMC
uniref:Uncharacterized protein n=1 Tax=Coturnix japonica TaxID=93934 RepID=A0A8C2U4R6_COTJA